MKPTYAPDNTRSSMIVILLLAAGVAIVAVLLGLSDKPEVRAIGISTGTFESASAPLGSTSAATDTTAVDDADPGAAGTGDATIEFDETGQPILDDSPGADAAAPVTTPGGDAGEGIAPTATAIPIPTATLVPTPEVAAAVEPTPDAGDSDAAALEDFGAPAVTPGVIAGQFFTRPDEDEGATVLRNELTVTLAEDGTGSFQGVLEMTLFDQTEVSLAMSGPLRWSNETPQVTAELMGNYSYDSPIDADDVTSNEAELTISSLGSGSGSLCTETCFGFTFPPQSGL